MSFGKSLVIALVVVGVRVQDGWAKILNVPSAQFPTIQSAIDFAASGDEIRIGPGSYGESLRIETKQLRLLGTSGAALTLLSPPTGSGVDVQNVPGSGVTLSGLTIAGAASGGVRILNSTFRLDNCIISACKDLARGGGLSAIDSTVTVVSSKLVKCEAGGGAAQVYGGGIFASNSALMISQATFDQCRAWNDAPTATAFHAVGGAMFVSGCLATLDGCQFLNCSASAADRSGACGLGKPSGQQVADDRTGGAVASGGGVAGDAGSDLSISNCRMIGCSVVAFAKALSTWESFDFLFGPVVARGGAVAGYQMASFVVRNSELQQCSAAASLDGFYDYGGSGRCNGPTAYYRTRVQWESVGGSIYAEGGDLAVDGCVLTGGGVSGNLTMVSGTDPPKPGAVTDPSYAGVDGGAIYLRSTASTSLSNTRLNGSSSSQIVLHSASATLIGVTGDGQGTATSLLKILGNSPIVNRCSASNYTSAGIASGGGAIPLISQTLMCGNGILGVSGNWLDGGGNLIQSLCVGTDCNHDGVDDAFQIAIGTVADCNGNGTPDSCDINAGTASDCDGDDVPDECQFPSARSVSPTLSPLQSGTLLTHTFSGLEPSGTPVVATFTSQGDLSSALEFVTVKANGTTLAKLWEVGGLDCGPLQAELLIPVQQFNDLVGSAGTLQFQFVPSAQVTPGQCAVSNIAVAIEYQPSTAGDANGNAVPDACEIAQFDLDQSGMIDMGDVAMLMLDFGPCAGCTGDFDQSGAVDFGDVALLMLQFGNMP